MAIDTASVKTFTSKVWRKVQGKAVEGIGFQVEEIGWLKEMKKAKLDPSLREVSRPLNINRAGGVASLGEGEHEALPGSPDAEEITATLIHFNKRINISKLIKFVDQGGGDTQLIADLKFRAKHASIAMSERIALAVYAPSSAILATTDTDLAGATTELTLTAGLNQSWITDPAYLVRPFVIGTTAGDKVSALVAGVKQTNARGYVTAKNPTTGTITVTWDGTAPSITTNGLQIVFANQMNDAKHDFNKGFNGWVDLLTAASLHGLATSSVPDWAVASADTTGGRYSGARLRVQQDAIEDEGGKVDRVMLDKAVYRDLILQYQSPLRVTDPYALPIDGDVKARGIQWQKSKRVPPGLAVPYDSSCVERFFWKPEMGDGEDMNWGELKEMEDVSAYIGTIDFVGNILCNKRKGLAYSRGLTRAT
jgi:hypothetical protein